MGGKPNPGTPRDKRLKANKTTAGKPAAAKTATPKFKPPFPGAAAPFTKANAKTKGRKGGAS